MPIMSMVKCCSIRCLSLLCIANTISNGVYWYRHHCNNAFNLTLFNLQFALVAINHFDVWCYLPPVMKIIATLRTSRTIRTNELGFDNVVYLCRNDLLSVVFDVPKKTNGMP